MRPLAKDPNLWGATLDVFSWISKSFTFRSSAVGSHRSRPVAEACGTFLERAALWMAGGEGDFVKFEPITTKGAVPAIASRVALLVVTGLAAVVLVAMTVVSNGSARTGASNQTRTASPTPKCPVGASGALESSQEAISYGICFLQRGGLNVDPSSAGANEMIEGDAVRELGIADGVDRSLSQRRVWVLSISGSKTVSNCPQASESLCSTEFTDRFYVYREGGGVGGGVFCTGACSGTSIRSGARPSTTPPSSPDGPLSPPANGLALTVPDSSVVLDPEGPADISVP